MGDLIQTVESPQEIARAAWQLRQLVRQKEIIPQDVLDIFEQWAGALSDRDLYEVPGITFLRLWLRRAIWSPCWSAKWARVR